MQTVTIAEKGIVSVKDITSMSYEEIDAEILSYTSEDLLNHDTILRLGELRNASKPFYESRMESRQRVIARLETRKNARINYVR